MLSSLIRARLNGKEGGAGRGGEGRERTKVQPGLLSKPLAALGAGRDPRTDLLLGGGHWRQEGLDGPARSLGCWQEGQDLPNRGFSPGVHPTHSGLCYLPLLELPASLSNEGQTWIDSPARPQGRFSDLE